MYAPANLNCNNRSTKKTCTEKYIADDEAVQSNIKLLTKIQEGETVGAWLRF